MTYLRLEGITKQFGSFVANDQISLTVDRGTIHGLLGENGAGKTTLMNILCGLYQPDTGHIYINDRPVKISSPLKAIALGIGMIHQHFMLVPQLSVTENIILGTTWSWRLNLSQKAEAIAQLGKTYGLDIDPNAKVGDLSVGVQQRVEILKALYRQAQLLILDEPTAVLTPDEVQNLIKILKQLAASGRTIIFISHKLEEVMTLCDRVTVLRRGQVVASTPVAATTTKALAQEMIGAEVLLSVNKSVNKSENTFDKKVVLEVQDLEVRDDRHLPAVQNLDFTLYAGEILGVAGVDGNGQRELAGAIAGLSPVSSGEIKLLGEIITHWSVKQRVQRFKLAYIPEDRQKMGLILGFNLARNLILKVFNRLPFCRRWLLQSQAIGDHTQTAIQNFDIRGTHPDVKVAQLSGGNQQKIILARELADNPPLILAMQPTRGLDIGATVAIQHHLLASRDRGAAILYISTELEEVMAMSDRIAVMYRGHFVKILDPKTATREQLGLLMTGAP
jgi:ABC-type uncharacterized transport system ATPase subunit